MEQLNNTFGKWVKNTPETEISTRMAEMEEECEVREPKPKLEDDFVAAEESTVTVGNFWGAADDVVPPNGETKEECEDHVVNAT